MQSPNPAICLVVQFGQADIDVARRGFRRRLQARGFSWQFFENRGEDAFGQALLEYSRALAKGVDVHAPRAWVIHCAWRRAQNALDREKREPPTVSDEDAAPLRSEDPGPEDWLIAEVSRGKFANAVRYLPSHEQELIERIYVDGMSCREAGRALGWGKSAADRHHQAALARLRPFFES